MTRRARTRTVQAGAVLTHVEKYVGPEDHARTMDDNVHMQNSIQWSTGWCRTTSRRADALPQQPARFVPAQRPTARARRTTSGAHAARRHAATGAGRHGGADSAHASAAQRGPGARAPALSHGTPITNAPTRRLHREREGRGAGAGREHGVPLAAEAMPTTTKSWTTAERLSGVRCELDEGRLTLPAMSATRCRTPGTTNRAASSTGRSARARSPYSRPGKAEQPASGAARECAVRPRASDIGQVIPAAAPTVAASSVPRSAGARRRSATRRRSREPRRAAARQPPEGEQRAEPERAVSGDPAECTGADHAVQVPSRHASGPDAEEAFGVYPLFGRADPRVRAGISPGERDRRER